MRLMSLLINCQSIQNQPRSIFSSRGLVLNHLSVQIPSTVLIYYYCTAQYHSMNCLSVQFQSLLLVLNSLFTLSLPTQVTLSIRCGLADLQKKTDESLQLTHTKLIKNLCCLPHPDSCSATKPMQVTVYNK